MLAEPFEEVLREIDKEINKYDFYDAVTAKFGGNTGKENDVDHPSINELNVPNQLTHAIHLSASSWVLLAEIPISLVNHMHAEGTWKRITRIGVVSDVSMSEVVGEKRSAGSITTQIELPKKKGFLREV